VSASTHSRRGGSGVRYALKFRVLVVGFRDQVSRHDRHGARVRGAHQALRNPAYLTGLLSVPVRPASTAIACWFRSLDGSRAICFADRLHVGRLDTRAFAGERRRRGPRRIGPGLVLARRRHGAPNPLNVFRPAPP